MEAILWTSLIGAGYSCLLYPLLLVTLCLRRAPAVYEPAQPIEASCPPATLIIAAYNEAERIREELENALAIAYTALETIVASDCSNDTTDTIIAEFEKQCARLIRAPERNGKGFAQLCAINAARHSILVFSDAGTKIEADSIRKVLRNFDDPIVGAISSEDRFLRNDGAVAGEGAYVKYEMLLLGPESQLAGLVGPSGLFFAARADLCADWSIEMPSDFIVAQNCAKERLRAVTARDVHGCYRDLRDPSREIQRKVRIALRGINWIAAAQRCVKPRAPTAFRLAGLGP